MKGFFAFGSPQSQILVMSILFLRACFFVLFCFVFLSQDRGISYRTSLHEKWTHLGVAVSLGLRRQSSGKEKFSDPAVLHVVFFFFFYQNVFNSKRLKCSYRNRDLALEDNQASSEYEVGYTFLFILVFCFGNHFRNIVGKYAKNCLQCLNTFLSSEIFQEYLESFALSKFEAYFILFVLFNHSQSH